MRINHTPIGPENPIIIQGKLYQGNHSGSLYLGIKVGEKTMLANVLDGRATDASMPHLYMDVTSDYSIQKGV